MKTEREKMSSGEWYDSQVPELEADRLKGQRFIRAYNHTAPEAKGLREEMIKNFFGSTTGPLYIVPPLYCMYGYNVHWGRNAFGNFNLTILDQAPVRVGNEVMIGPNVQLITACHPLDAERRNALIEWAEPITIEDNVWIGAGVIVLPGVTIGENAVIGAGSVVTQDIPANVLAVGNPCKVIKQIDPLAKEEGK